METKHAIYPPLVSHHICSKNTYSYIIFFTNNKRQLDNFVIDLGVPH